MDKPDKDDEMDYVFRNVENELHRINTAKKKTDIQAKQSFAEWLSEALNTVGRAIGYVVTLPIRAFTSLWDFLFGK